jgi:ESS family glutamate:Na+ symporter
MTGALLFVAVLLLVGVILRLRVPLFRWLYIPASVIAGIVGLVIVQAIGSLSQRLPSSSSLPFGGGQLIATKASQLDAILQSWTGVLGQWPSFLIAVVFAGMLLERKPVPIRESISQVGRQGLMVWIIVLGQTALGLLATGLLIQPFYDVPNSVGMLIETGFAGGHGTAAAMGKVFASDVIDFDSGLDLGILMATCGLVYGVITGILWINLAIRWGWIAAPESAATVNTAEPASEVPIGHAKVGSETIDPLLLQILWLTLAIGVGMAMQSGVAAAAGAIDDAINTGRSGSDEQLVLSSRLSATAVLDFPLFIYTLFGGLIVRMILRRAGHERAVDRDTINRLTSTAMDVLVVAAITSLNLAAVASLIVPFSVLFVCGAIWSGVCLLVIARLVLPPAYWFPLGLINYGMSTGTTATGFVLLRVVDPELESGAAEDYALAAPLSSPFIGGGMITVALPLLLLERVPIAAATIVAMTIVAAMIYVGYRWNRPEREIVASSGE